MTPYLVFPYDRMQIELRTDEARVDAGRSIRLKSARTVAVILAS